MRVRLQCSADFIAQHARAAFGARAVHPLPSGRTGGGNESVRVLAPDAVSDAGQPLGTLQLGVAEKRSKSQLRAPRTSTNTTLVVFRPSHYAASMHGGSSARTTIHLLSFHARSSESSDTTDTKISSLESLHLTTDTKISLQKFVTPVPGAVRLFRRTNSFSSTYTQ